MVNHDSSPSISTDEKIKLAAREVFLKKGFAATRTRDIAEASGENLALINYYFRSKENLYRIIMIETMGTFINTMIPVFNDESTNLNQKVEQIVERYTDLFISQPAIPLFVINELHTGSENFMAQSDVMGKIKNSLFFKQLHQAATRGGRETVHPLQFFMSIMGMILFPFLARPVLQKMGSMDDNGFMGHMQDRKKLIPIWVESLINY